MTWFILFEELSAPSALHTSQSSVFISYRKITNQVSSKEDESEQRRDNGQSPCLRGAFLAVSRQREGEKTQLFK